MALDCVKLRGRVLLRACIAVAAALATAVPVSAAAAEAPLKAGVTAPPPALALDTVTLSGGRLIIEGKTAAPDTVVSIAGTPFSARSGAAGNFRFNLNYRTPDCRIRLTTGSASITAVISACGTQGVIGNTGPTGIAGPSGPTGLAGKRGDPGVRGVTGDTGPTGPGGLAGPAGPIGNQGAIGHWSLIPVSERLPSIPFTAGEWEFVGPTYTHPRGNVPTHRISLTASITAGLGTTGEDVDIYYGLCVAYGGFDYSIEGGTVQRAQATKTTSIFSLDGSLVAGPFNDRGNDNISFVFGFCVATFGALDQNSVLNGWIMVEETPP